MINFKQNHPILMMLATVIGVFLFFALVTGHLTGQDKSNNIPKVTGDMILEAPTDRTLTAGLSPWASIADSIIEIKTDVRGDVYYEINVFGAIVPGSLLKATRELEKMNREGNTAPLVIHINTPGGSAGELLEFTTVAQSYGGVIVTVNDGIAFSAGAVLYALGDVRVSGKGALVLFHSMQTSYKGPLNYKIATEIRNDIMNFNMIIYRLLMSETGQTERSLRGGMFIEDNEQNFLNVGMLKDFRMLDLETREYNNILNYQGINEVVRFNNNQDDEQLVEEVFTTILELFGSN